MLKINQQFYEMVELIDALLLYSRAGYQNLECELVPLRHIVEDAIEGIENQVVKEKAEISIPELSQVYVDQSLMMKVFMNLISNAIKYKGEGVPKIDIQTSEAREGFVLIKVKDQGVGLKEQHLKDFFEPFMRFSTDSSITGSGIGSSICQKVIERHGGDIWVHSEGEGQEIEICFELPLDRRLS